MTTSVISGLGIIFIGLVTIVGIFAMVREIVLWYFRINESIQIAKESRDYLKELVRLASAKEEIEEEETQTPESEAELRQRRLPAHFRR